MIKIWRLYFLVATDITGSNTHLVSSLSHMYYGQYVHYSDSKYECFVANIGEWAKYTLNKHHGSQHCVSQFLESWNRLANTAHEHTNKLWTFKLLAEPLCTKSPWVIKWVSGTLMLSKKDFSIYFKQHLSCAHRAYEIYLLQEKKLHFVWSNTNEIQ